MNESISEFVLSSGKRRIFAFSSKFYLLPCFQIYMATVKLFINTQQVEKIWGIEKLIQNYAS